jgi:hypothetical protein
MAASILPKPGTKFGPCARSRHCAHRDCKETYAMAETPCRLCGSLIGYGVRFIRARLSGALAHELCVEHAIERNDARVGEF